MAAYAGVKDLLAGEQQTAVTVAMEGLMDAKPAPELEAFATFDPRVRPCSQAAYRHTVTSFVHCHVDVAVSIIRQCIAANL